MEQGNPIARWLIRGLAVATGFMIAVASGTGVLEWGLREPIAGPLPALPQDAPTAENRAAPERSHPSSVFALHVGFGGRSLIVVALLSTTGMLVGLAAGLSGTRRRVLAIFTSVTTWGLLVLLTFAASFSGYMSPLRWLPHRAENGEIGHSAGSLIRFFVLHCFALPVLLGLATAAHIAVQWRLAARANRTMARSADVPTPP